MENNAPGRLKLKVTGILYIISAALTIIMGLLFLAGGTVFLTIDEGSSSFGSFLGVVAGAVGVVMVISAVYTLIMGILGVKNSNKPEKCGVNFVLGVIMLVFAVLGFLFTLVSVAGGSSASSLVSSIVALVIAIIYTMGAKQNKNASRSEE
ncbi:MAG: hypothetical protein ACOX8E_06730 [Ruminococcus sp.]|jgi:hypothetical protein